MPKPHMKSNGQAAQSASHTPFPGFPSIADLFSKPFSPQSFAPPNLTAQGFPAMAMWQPMLMAMADWNGHLGMTAAAIGKEWCGFLEMRMQQDVVLGEKLATCRDADQALRVVAAYYQRAFDDYQKEAMAMSKLGGNLSGSNVETAYRCFDYAARSTESRSKSQPAAH